MAIFRSVLYAQLKYFFMVWIIAVVVCVFVHYFGISNLPDTILWSVFWIFGFIVSLFSAKTRFYQERYFSVLKSSCKNIINLWMSVFIQNAVLLGLTVVIFALLRFKINLILLTDISVWEGVSFLSVIYLAMCMSDSSQLLERVQVALDVSKKEIVRYLFYSAVCGGYFFGLLWIYEHYSPLLCLSGVSLAFLFVFVFFTDEFVKTIPSNNRWKFFSGGSIVVVIFQAGLGYGDHTFSKSPNYLVQRERTWSFKDIEKIKTIEDWILWQNKLSSLESLTVDEIIASYELLTQLCPPVPRDAPLVINCFGEAGYTDYQSTGKTNRTEEDVLKLMSAPFEYSQIMGLMYARKLKKPLSKDLILAIEYIAEKESTIQGLARNTLTLSVPENFTGILKIQTEIQKVRTHF